MKLRNYIKLAIMAVVITTAVSSCQTYKKFDLPKDGAAGEYAAAKDEAVDSAAFGNLISILSTVFAIRYRNSLSKGFKIAIGHCAFILCCE